MPVTPKPEGPSQVIAFRCAPAEAAWLRGYVTPKIRLSAVAAWAMGYAREYVTALDEGEFDPVLTRLALLEDVPRSRILARVLRLGLAAYAHEEAEASAPPPKRGTRGP